MPRTITLVAFALLALRVPTLSQDIAFVCDSADDVIYRMVDFDSDGVIDPTSEANLFYDDSSPGPDLSTPSHLHAYGDGLLVSDSGTLDAVLFIRDNNRDGDGNDDGEITPFYDDTSSGPNLSTPNGIAVTADGVVYVSDDGSGVKSIFRLFDGNADGDALDDGEITTFYDATAAEAGPTEDPESIAVAFDGTVYVGDSVLGQVYRLQDLNSDGDALDPGESVLFYDGAAVPVGDVDSLQVTAAGVVYVIDEDNGTIIRLEDSDQDGAIGASEATVFSSGSVITDPNDARLTATGALVVADGAEDALYIVEDLDGDGTASGLDEVRPFFHDAGVLLATPSGVEFISSPPPPAAPIVLSLSATLGSTDGGTAVDIVGSGLLDVTTVLFGGVSVSEFVVESDALIHTSTPAVAQSGAVAVTVQSAAGSASLVDAFVYSTPFLRGDANGDGAVHVTDAVVVLEALLGTMTPACDSALDANDDAVVEISDAIYLLAYLFQFGPPPPAPFPTPGIDTTVDALPCD